MKNFILLSFLLSSVFVRAESAPLTQGSRAIVEGRAAAVTLLETLPHVESEYTKRFKFESAENPKLKELRERYKLEEVVAPGKDEFEKQVLLMDWTHRQFKKFGRPDSPARGGLEVLQAIGEGHTFFCSQYGQVLASAAASLGWVDRLLALRRHQGNAKDGSSEHTSTEIWSNQYGKWVMLDPTANMHLEKDGIPLNAWEIRQEWFYNSGKDLVFVLGKDQVRKKKENLPVALESFPGFGQLSISPDELDKYGFTGYIPNTDIMESPFDYGKMFIVKDKLCEGTRWHERLNPANPAVEPYFPINQAALTLQLDGSALVARAKTLTPNFKTFETCQDGGAWLPCPAEFKWPLKPGANQLEMRAVNKFNVPGPASRAVVELAP